MQRDHERGDTEGGDADAASDADATVRGEETNATGREEEMAHTEHWEDISELAQRAGVAREEFVPPEDPPDEEQAMAFLREGVGPAIMVYVDARTGEWVRFPPVEHSLLERTLNDFLELYARCYGREIECQFTVREAAETLVETHNVLDTARILTHVPEREAMRGDWSGDGSD